MTRSWAVDEIVGVRPGFAGPNESVIQTTLHGAVSASAEGAPWGNHLGSPTTEALLGPARP